MVDAALVVDVEAEAGVVGESVVVTVFVTAADLLGELETVGVLL